uniref:Uncharacterized protein n=1 Tax=Triticum urartu TaxID=4572 RepID=A0A8R7USM2_TRIUA
PPELSPRAVSGGRHPSSPLARLPSISHGPTAPSAPPGGGSGPATNPSSPATDCLQYPPLFSLYRRPWHPWRPRGWKGSRGPEIARGAAAPAVTPQVPWNIWKRGNSKLFRDVFEELHITTSKIDDDLML